MDSDDDLFDDPRMGNPWLRNATLCLNLIGAIYLLSAVFGGPGYGYVLSNEGAPLLLAIGIAAVLFLVSISFSLVLFLTAFLIGRGNKLGWVLGLIFGVLFSPFLCPPIGLVILYGLLNAQSRKTFLG